MVELVLIGIGTGNLEHLTLEALREMRECDLILLPRKGDDKAALAEVRQELCARHLDAGTRISEFDMPVRDASVSPYKKRVDDWHEAIAGCWFEAIGSHTGDVKKVGVLVWGDPSLYDSTLRIAEKLPEGMQVKVRVVPGVTSLQCLTAAHAITLNTIGEPVQITTGRQLRDNGFPAGVDTVAVMLDGECSFQTLDPHGIEIWWGGYVGMPQQVLRSGPLSEAGPEIMSLRAAAREKHGWIMDIYILRRSTRPPVSTS